MILVTGARGVVGAPLVERLEQEGRAYLSVSRASSAGHNQLQWDLHEPAEPEVLQAMAQVDVLIHCAPIWLLAERLIDLQQTNLKRIVVFSSTSVLSKVDSTNKQEQGLVAQLKQAEHNITEFCLKHDWQLTILRPSLIYGYGRDQNISHIAGMIKRFGFMILVGQGTGKRQPVHADDLVEASLAVLENPECIGKVYNLAGNEVLSYRAMVERVFIGLEKKPRIVALPLMLVRLVLGLAAKISSFSYTPEMADRMNQNMNYDFSEAQTDFAYRPQAFLVKPQRDLNTTQQSPIRPKSDR